MASYRAEVLADSPFAYWRLRERSGTTATAETGGFNGTYTGGYTLGQSGPTYDGRGVKLNGATGFIDTASGSGLNVGANGPISIEFWVKRNGTGTKDEIIAHGGSAFEALFSDAGLPGGADKMQMWNGSVQMAVEATTLTDTTSWHHYVITWAGPGAGSGNIAKVYRDGADNTGTPAGPAGVFTDSATNLRIGATTSGANPGDFTIAEVALYNYVLPAARVLAHYNAAQTQDNGNAFQSNAFQDGAFQDPQRNAFQDDAFQDDAFQLPHSPASDVTVSAELASGDFDPNWDPYELDFLDDPEADVLGTATATAYNATVQTAVGSSTDAPAEAATATGAAYNASASVAPNAGNAASTGAASNATPSVAPNAGNAAATGAASNAAASIAPTSGAATATGAANQATASVAPNSGNAAATGAAGNAAGSVGASGGLASATGSAGGPAGSLAVNAGLASATGAAYDATVRAGKEAAAEAATGTGAAYDAAASIAPNGGNAAAIGAASDAAASVAPNGGNAAATGSAKDAAGSVAASSGAATGTGAAGAPAGSIAVNGGNAGATGAAYDATIDTTTPACTDGAFQYWAFQSDSFQECPAWEAYPGTATGTGSAYDAAASVAPNVGNAGATASAFDASIKVSISAGVASATASASSASGSVAPNAGAALATGTAFAGTVAIAVGAGFAAATAEGFDASVPDQASHGGVPPDIRVLHALPVMDARAPVPVLRPRAPEPDIGPEHPIPALTATHPRT